MIYKGFPFDVNFSFLNPNSRVELMINATVFDY